jgi:MraZ protein
MGQFWVKEAFVDTQRPKFKGNQNKTLDPHGRVKLPPKYREQLISHPDQKVWLMPNLDGGLNLYREEEYLEIEEKVNMLPKGRKSYRILANFINTEAFECKIDAQGRIRIPQSLLEYADLLNQKEVKVAGNGTFVQLWNVQRYKENMLHVNLDLDFDDLDIQI